MRTIPLILVMATLSACSSKIRSRTDGATPAPPSAPEPTAADPATPQPAPGPVKVAPIATLTGAPVATSGATVLAVTVAGDAVVAYRHKVVAATATDCAQAEGYGSEQPVAMLIANDLTTLADGGVVLCVVGREATGTWQELTAATTAEWTKDAKPPGAFQLLSPGTVSDRTPLLSWEAAPDAVAYDVAIGLDASCASPVAAFPGLTTLAQAVGPLEPATYHVCLRARDATGNTAPPTSGPHTFTVPSPRALGQQDLTSNAAMTPQSLYAPNGVHAAGGRLYVADTNNNRVLVWDQIPGATLEAADRYLLQKGFDTRVDNCMAADDERNCGPWGIFSDGTRLIISDRNNHRVLIWNTLPTSSEVKPDLVLGQPDMTSNVVNSGGVSAKSLSSPHGVYSDGTHLAIADNGNNRVLVWSTFPTTSFQAADLVLGQPDFVATTANNNVPGTTADKHLKSPKGLHGDGTRLFVVDSGNHRVLIWSAFPSTMREAATYSLGQATVGGKSANRGATVAANTLNSPQGVLAVAGALFVTDTENFRVLKWNAIPAAHGVAADLVLGQPDLVTDVKPIAVTGTTMSQAVGLASDGTRLFLADAHRSRVVVWSTLPTATQQAPDFVLGQVGLDGGRQNGATLPSAQTIRTPHGVSTRNGRLAVAESCNRVLLWNQIPMTHGQPADLVLGQADFSTCTANLGGTPGPQTMWNPRFVHLDGTRVLVPEESNNRVLIWSSWPTASGQSADLVLGQADFTSIDLNRGGAAAANTLRAPRMAFSDGTRLYIADTNNNRVLVWTTFPTLPGQAADLVLGQADMTTVTANTGGVTGASMKGPNSVRVDGGRLLVADTGNHRVLIWSAPPTATGQTADLVLGQPDLTAATANNGGISAQSLNQPNDAHFDGERLYVADQRNSRVLVWRGMPTANSVAADEVLGQPGFTTATPANGGLSATSLTLPEYVHTDEARVFISDGNADRVVVLPKP